MAATASATIPARRDADAALAGARALLAGRGGGRAAAEYLAGVEGLEGDARVWAARGYCLRAAGDEEEAGRCCLRAAVLREEEGGRVAMGVATAERDAARTNGGGGWRGADMGAGGEAAKAGEGNRVTDDSRADDGDTGGGGEVGRAVDENETKNGSGSQEGQWKGPLQRLHALRAAALGLLGGGDGGRNEERQDREGGDACKAGAAGGADGAEGAAAVAMRPAEVRLLGEMKMLRAQAAGLVAAVDAAQAVEAESGRRVRDLMRIPASAEEKHMEHEKEGGAGDHGGGEVAEGEASTGPEAETSGDEPEEDEEGDEETTDGSDSRAGFGGGSFSGGGGGGSSSSGGGGGSSSGGGDGNRAAFYDSSGDGWVRRDAGGGGASSSGSGSGNTSGGGSGERAGRAGGQRRRGAVELRAASAGYVPGGRVLDGGPGLAVRAAVGAPGPRRRRRMRAGKLAHVTLASRARDPAVIKSAAAASAPLWSAQPQQQRRTQGPRVVPPAVPQPVIPVLSSAPTSVARRAPGSTSSSGVAIVRAATPAASSSPESTSPRAERRKEEGRGRQASLEENLSRNLGSEWAPRTWAAERSSVSPPRSTLNSADRAQGSGATTPPLSPFETRPDCQREDGVMPALIDSESECGGSGAASSAAPFANLIGRRRRRSRNVLPSLAGTVEDDDECDCCRDDDSSESCPSVSASVDELARSVDSLPDLMESDSDEMESSRSPSLAESETSEGFRVGVGDPAGSEDENEPVDDRCSCPFCVSGRGGHAEEDFNASLDDDEDLEDSGDEPDGDVESEGAVDDGGMHWGVDMGQRWSDNGSEVESIPELAPYPDLIAEAEAVRVEIDRANNATSAGNAPGQEANEASEGGDVPGNGLPVGPDAAVAGQTETDGVRRRRTRRSRQRVASSQQDAAASNHAGHRVHVQGLHGQQAVPLPPESAGRVIDIVFSALGGRVHGAGVEVPYDSTNGDMPFHGITTGELTLPMLGNQLGHEMMNMLLNGAMPFGDAAPSGHVEDDVGPGGIGLQKEFIENIAPAHELRPHLDGSVACIICTEALGEGLVRRMPCDGAHIFHSECIDQWLSAHSTCPTCRTDFADVVAPTPFT